jgi:hypothetical protein
MKKFLPIVIFILMSSLVKAQSGSELTFIDPVLVSGINLKQGAVYRFSNVKTGVDATIRLKRFSRNDIHMATIDNSVFGWAKAFQPEFGITGSVPPNQNWYIDFEVTFYIAGTGTRIKLDTVDFTALDVDGDNVTLNEYVTYDRPNSIEFATSTALTTSPAGLLGTVVLCDEDGISSAIITCPYCGGSGVLGGLEDVNCDGTGKLHNDCLHPYQGGTGTGVNGPITNFANIDTSATLVMSVYRYLDRDRINFRYGARTSDLSTTAGVRLNSMWFRRFRVDRLDVLPLQMTSFTLSRSNSNVNLNWTTSSEKNISKYVIEKSTDGKQFKECGSVDARNTTNQNYHFSDPVIGNENQVLYYRIRTQEASGEVSYSLTRIIRINNSMSEEIKLNTFPNPVTSELRISIPENWQNQKVIYEILTGYGKRTLKKEVSSANLTEQINVSSLSPGVYILSVNCNGTVKQNKFLKF